jgi:FkbM family methyltransferase
MIKETKEGYWVIEGDFNIGTWVEQEGRLNINHCPRETVLKYTEPGTIAIDCGANIGSYTSTLLEGVGENGIVYAFEADEEIFRCLEHNCPRAICLNKALSDKEGEGVFQKLAESPGSSFVYTGRKFGTYAEKFPSQLVPIQFTTLDLLGLASSERKISLIKIDVEGCETQLLRGAEATIRKHRPVLMLELNEEALRIQGDTPQNLAATLSSLNYRVEFVQPTANWNTPLCDLICFPE